MGGRGARSGTARITTPAGGATGVAGGAGATSTPPVGTPQNPAPNGFTGAVNGKDISNTVTVPDRADPSTYSGQQWHRGIEIENVMDAQGFRGKPQIITDDTEFENAVKASWGGQGLRMYRGDGASDKSTLDGYDDALKSGDWYVQCYGGNVHGYGFYTAYRCGGAKVQSDYDESYNYGRWNGGPVVSVKEMTLAPNAKVVSEQQVKSEMQAHNAAARQQVSQARAQRNQAQRQATAPILQQLSGGSRAQVAAAKAWKMGRQDATPRRGTTAKYQSDFNAAMKSLRAARDSVNTSIPVPTIYRDHGVYAAAKGYDAMSDRGTGYMVVLNRTKLIIHG